MTPEALATIQAGLAADVPVLLIGPPGGAKTASITQLARAAGARLEVLIGSQIDERDCGGIYYPVDGRVVSLPVPWAERLAAARREGQEAWLCLDELGRTPRIVQAALLRIVHERRVGDIDLRGVRVIAATNSTGVDLSAAMANRWLHLPWPVDATVWCAAMREGFGEAQGVALAQARALVASYVARNPSALLAPPLDAERQGGAWPSPRTWDFAARVLACVEGWNRCEDETAADVAVHTLHGLVGEAAASEFLAWSTDLGVLADPEEVLQDPLGYPLPERDDQIHALLGALGAAVAFKPATPAEQQRRWCDAVRVLGRVPRDVALLGSEFFAKHNPFLKAPALIPNDVALVWETLHVRGTRALRPARPPGSNN